MNREQSLLRTCLRMIALVCLVMGGSLINNEALAQTTNGRFVVTVKDPTGAVIAGADVTIVNNGTGQQVTGTTNETGGFVSPLLPVGLYTLTVEAAGFKKTISENLKLDVASDYGISVNMEAGGGNDIVTVTAGEELVQTTNAEVKNIVNEKQIQDLPLNGRDPLQLIQLQAGVNGNLARTVTVINGQRTSTSQVTQDGINIQDNFIRSNGLDFSPNRPTVAFVSEFSVTTLNPGAETAGSSSVRLVTPSGTNEYHGSVFEFNRNSAAAAGDFFDNLQKIDKTFLNRNQFGYTLSGPVKIPGVYDGKDKLFFFTYYEGFRQRTGNTLTTTVFNPLARNGIFTYRDNAGAIRTLNVLAARSLTIDPFVANLLARVPNTINNNLVGDGLNTGGFTFARGVKNDRNVAGFRFDYNINEKFRFEGIYNYAAEDVGRPDIDVSFNRDLKVKNVGTTHFFVFALNMNLSPRLNNEVRIGRNFTDPDFRVNDDLGTDILTNTAGLISNPLVTFRKQGRTTVITSYIDNASISLGNHFVRFGGQYDRIRVRARNAAGTTPTINFGISTAAPAGFGLTARDFPGGIDGVQLGRANALLAFLSGTVTSAAVTFNATSQGSGFVPGAMQLRKLELDLFAPYVTDAWRVTPRITLNLGVRYDYISPLREGRNFALLPARNVRTDGLSDAASVVLNPNGRLVFADGGFYDQDLNNFAPNVSLAWDIPGLGRQTVLRLGYSINYVNDETIRAADNAAIANAGLTQAVSRTNLFGFLSRDQRAILNLLSPPMFQVPRTFAQNFALDPGAAAFIIKPNFETPYYHQFNFSIEREVFKDTVVTARYVGNLSRNLARGVDINQVDVRRNGFANDVAIAQQNGFLALARTGVFDPRFNPNIPGSRQLSVFPMLAGGGLLTNATIRALIQTGEAGTLAQVYVQNRLTGNVRFLANPNIFVADILGNGGESDYHAFQVEVRRRFANGLQFQANYAFSKALTNTPDGTGQTRFEPLLDNEQRSLERSRASFDVPHAFKANFLYELPIGPGKQFFNAGGIVGKLIGGYQITSIINVQTGPPFSILSGRGTLNRGGRSGNNTADSSLTVDQIKDLLGVFKTPNGIFFIDPKVIGPNGSAVAPDGSNPFPGQVFFNPGPGRVGSLARLQFNGPTAYSMDFSIIKRTVITERVNTEFRAEFFNVFNHPIFFIGDQNINSPNFGRINSVLVGPRVIQFAAKVNF